MPYQGKLAQLFRENSWIHIFLKSISAMWNAVNIWTRVAKSTYSDDNQYHYTNLKSKLDSALSFSLPISLFDLIKWHFFCPWINQRDHETINFKIFLKKIY